MTTKLRTASAREQRVADLLRRAALARLDEMSTHEAAAALGLAPFGVESLRSRKTWTLEKAFRVCDALDDQHTRRVQLALETDR